MTLPGVGKVIAAVFVAEIGDIRRRFGQETLQLGRPNPRDDRESDEVVHRGTITKQGSPLVRWAAIEAVGNYQAKGNEKLRADYKLHRRARRQVQGPRGGGRHTANAAFYACATGTSDASRPPPESQPTDRRVLD